MKQSDSVDVDVASLSAMSIDKRMTVTTERFTATTAPSSMC